MQLDEFLENYYKLVFVPLEDYLYFPESGELYDAVSDETVCILDIEALLAFPIGDKTVKDIIEDENYQLLEGISGGRGSSSASGGGQEQEFKFGHASGNGNEDIGKQKFPAEFNDGEKVQSLEKALQKFRDKHADADHEYAIAVDKDGYVHKYIEGGRSSVAIAGRDGQMIIHNHPSDGAFSDSDLLSVAQVAGERGIIASGKSGDYIFEKGKNFDGTAFAKAVKSAKLRGTSYDDAVDKWLTQNQAKYGYKYRYRKA